MVLFTEDEVTEEEAFAAMIAQKEDNPSNIKIETYSDVFLNNPNSVELDWTDRYHPQFLYCVGNF